MAGGYIKLYRQMCDWEWYGDANVFRVFLHLLLNAQHEETRWQGKVIQRGQVVTGRKKLSEILRLSEQQIRTALAKLESTGEITKKSTNEYTIVTICKWDNYQVSFSDEQPTDNQRITNEQPTNNHIQECKEYNNNISSTSSRACTTADFDEMKGESGLIESIMMLNHVDQETVYAKIDEFKAHCIAGMKTFVSKGDLRTHFRDWVRIRIQAEKQSKQQNNGVQAKYDPTGSYEPKSTREDYFL